MSDSVEQPHSLSRPSTFGSLPTPYGSQQAPPRVNAPVSKSISNPTPDGSPGGTQQRLRTRSNSLTDSGPIHKMNSTSDQSMPVLPGPAVYDVNRTVSEAERGVGGSGGGGVGLKGSPRMIGRKTGGMSPPTAPPQQQPQQHVVNRTVSEAERGVAAASSPPHMTSGPPPVRQFGQPDPNPAPNPPTMSSIYPGPRPAVTIPQAQPSPPSAAAGGPPLPSGVAPSRDSSKESPGGVRQGAGVGLSAGGPPPMGGPTSGHNYYNPHVPGAPGIRQPAPAPASVPAPAVGVFPSMGQQQQQQQARNQQQTPLNAGRRPSNPLIHDKSPAGSGSTTGAFASPASNAGGTPMSAGPAATRRPSLTLGRSNPTSGGFGAGDALHTNTNNVSGAAIPEILEMASSEHEKEHGGAAAGGLTRGSSPAVRVAGARGWLEFILQSMNTFLTLLIALTIVFVITLFALLYGHVVVPHVAPLVTLCVGGYQSLLVFVINSFSGDVGQGGISGGRALVDEVLDQDL